MKSGEGIFLFFFLINKGGENPTVGELPWLPQGCKVPAPDICAEGSLQSTLPSAPKSSSKLQQDTTNLLFIISSGWHSAIAT